MTVDEIVASLEDQAADKKPFVWDTQAENDPEDMIAQDIQALLEAAELLRRMKPPNEPLTEDELREMDGAPVWIKSMDDNEKETWSFVDEEHSMVRVLGRGMVGLRHFRTYGRTWLAYRRKPEEGTV